MSSSSTARAWWLALILIFSCARPPQTTAYSVETHEAISQAAVRDAEVDQLLKDALGLSNGRTTTIKGKLAERWVMEGATREDDEGRYFYHFHNPLADWNQSGLRLLPILPASEASVLWAQNTGNDWSLDKVRLARTNALAGSTRAVREDALVYLLRGLGQLIHLIQDAASPGHTRNDPHVGGNYEKLVRDLHTRSPARDQPYFDGLLADPKPPGSGWRTLQANPLASPSNTVARLIDTELYQTQGYYVGTNPEATMDTRIGLGEYTNANFLSEDSTWESQWLSLPRPFRYPARPNTIVASNICEEYTNLCPEGGDLRRLYYLKEPPGDAGYRLATVGFLRDYFVRWNLPPTRASQRPALDETVYRDYAWQLVRRAVGYSVAFLEDFLRGEFSVEVTNSEEGNFFWVTNIGDRTMEGRFEFYYERPDGTLVYWWVNTFGLVALSPGQAVGHVRYSLAPGSAVTCRYIFRGRFEGEPPLQPGSDPFTWPVRSAHAVACPLQEG